jgi:cell wall-associated NlpC family hydrolase
LFQQRALLRSVLIGAAVAALMAPACAAHADPTPTEIQAQIDKGNNDVELIVEQYDKVNGDLTATQAALAAIEAKIQPLQASMDAAHSNVDQIAVTAYETGSDLEAVSVMLSAGSSDNIVDQLSTLQEISRHQNHQVADFAAAKAGYDTEKQRLDALLATQNQQKTDLADRKHQIESDIARLDAMQQKLNGANSKITTVYYGPAPVVPGAAGKVVNYAWAQLNKRYVWGTAGPDTFDCSGLTMMAWRAAGVSLPHNAAEQYQMVHHIARSQLAPGDLVFYNSLGHVGIYIGNNQIVHAPNSRTVVKVSPIDIDPISGYGRP